jgi:hypothetical protein
MPEMKPLITLRPDEIILSVRPRSKREELTS